MSAAVPFIGPAIGAATSLFSGFSAAGAAKYQAEVAKNNQKVAEWNAARASVRGGIEAQMKDAEYSQLIGQQVAQQAASGVSVAGGSQIRSRNMTRMYAAGDRQTIRENAALENYNYRVEATNFKAEAKALKKEARNAMIGGILGAAGSLASAPLDKMKSLIGGAKSTSKVPIPTARPSGHRGIIPVPKPKPRMMPSIGGSGLNPLLRNKYSMGH